MKKNDLIQLVFTPEEKETLEQSLSSLESMASKNTPDLSSEDRQNLGSINDINKLFVNKCQVMMEQNPQLIPAFVDVDEFTRDFDARKQVEDMILRLDVIQRQLSDTKVLLDHDNYHDALTFYRSVRYYAREQQESAIPIYDVLKRYFPGHKAESNPVETEE
ncbi:hypothetical protein [Ancylomarina longa]|nr:hypothetical protein [Ancylomarina longa]